MSSPPVRPADHLTQPVEPDLAAELAGYAFPGEGEPADTALAAAKAPRSAGLPFDLAAVLCGHDPATGAGAENARHDYRVWDLVGGDVLVIHHARTGDE